jgi:hypothetical protein
MNVSFVELFGDNPAALEIAREQRDFWEFRLTAALLRAKLQPSLRRCAICGTASTSSG